MSLIVVVIGVSIVLLFDFVNGFHDAANAIATVVATRVLSPRSAVIMAAMGNFVGWAVFGVAIAKTIGKGIIEVRLIEEFGTILIMAALAGAIIWDLITWWWGLPTSSSHALIGGLLGVALAASGVNSIVEEGVLKTVAFMIIAPLLGFFGAFLFTVVIMRSFSNVAHNKTEKLFATIQIGSAFLYSVAHGTNDAQKGMGIIAMVLVAEGVRDQIVIDNWIALSCHAAIALGTLFGGWRIVKTLAHRVTTLKPYQGFCAETGGGLILLACAEAGIPVSTTHVISSAIMGVGTTKPGKAVRWSVFRNIIWAWIFTIPASMFFSFAIFKIIMPFI
ncbi:MAG: anion permease [Candidatus Kariarchaeaceae archaeon]|jgi:PiT family inorganic phosphate transporter